MKIYLVLLITISYLFSCKELEIYEKNTNIPQSNWLTESPIIGTISIKDTASSYQIFNTLRHTNKYNFQNIWLDLLITDPNNKTIINNRYELTIGNEKEGWAGIGLGDIWDVRIQVENKIKFPVKGIYKFQIKQIMRQNPLKEIISAGLRIEKIKI